MKNPLLYPLEKEFHNQAKLMVLQELFLLNKEEGVVCDKCKTIQGKPKNGFKKYYCIHLRKKVQGKIKKEKIKKIVGNILSINFSENVIEV